MIYELRYTFDAYGQTLNNTMAFKTKEEAEKRSEYAKLTLQARNVEIIEHKRATKYIIDGDGFRRYAE